MSEYDSREEREALEAEFDQLEPVDVSVSESLREKVARIGDEAYERRNEPIPEDVKRRLVARRRTVESDTSERQKHYREVAKYYDSTDLSEHIEQAAWETMTPDDEYAFYADPANQVPDGNPVVKGDGGGPAGDTEERRLARRDRLAAMSLAEIDAMSDQEVAELMGATPDEFASEPAWAWREAAKIATDEYADQLTEDIRAGRARLITDPAGLRRLRERRPNTAED